MSVIRVHKNKNFTVMSNVHLRDMDLSLKAKGLLSVMLSLPDNWNYSIVGLCSICKENETAIKSTIKELKERRYVIVDKKYPNQTESKKYEYVYHIFEEPQPENQEVEKQGVENLPLDNLPIENHPLNKRTDRSSTDKSNTDRENTKGLNTDDKYALEDVKRPSSKGNMYASVPEEQEAAAPKKQSRYIPKDYNEEQLRKHIKPVVENEVNQYIEDMDVKFPDDRAKTFLDILCLFCCQYKERFGENHYVMPDKTVKSAVRRYLEPPEEMDGTFDAESYEELIDLYFKTDFNKIGKFKDENGKKRKVVLSFPHFMSDTIRGNLANRLWK